MGTRARIGLLDPEANVRSIYSHWDGYPTGAGKTLAEHWSDPAKLTELLDLGDVSSLGWEVGEKHDFDKHGEYVDGKLAYDPPGSEHWCNAYGRDRGEQDVASKTHALDNWPDYGQEWEYVYDPANGWLCRGLWQDDKSWKPLSEWIEIEEQRIEEYTGEGRA